jgi:Vps52 / Sac2 family.
LVLRFFFEFALAHERAVAHEIRNEYVDTMSKVYFSYFKSYSTLLNKMQVRIMSSFSIIEYIYPVYRYGENETEKPIYSPNKVLSIWYRIDVKFIFV